MLSKPTGIKSGTVHNLNPNLFCSPRKSCIWLVNTGCSEDKTTHSCFQTLPSNLLVSKLTDTLSGTNICKKTHRNVVSAIVFSESINVLIDPGTTNQAGRVGSINKTQIPVTQIIASSFKNLLNLVFRTSTLFPQR